MKNIISKEFTNRLNQIYNTEELEIIYEWFNILKRKVSFRINILKATEYKIVKYLKNRGLEVKKVDYLNNWYILLNWNEKSLWDLDIFKEWQIYLQSLSSQLPIDLLKETIWKTILDITAAPWWKTSQICSMMKNTWEIIALDNNQIRIDKLNFTLNRQWCKNVKVIKANSIDFFKNNEKYNNYFDIIIADLPCSAEWKINFNKEKTYWFWDESIINKNYKLQKKIIQTIIPLLKNWWQLIYSTCTLAPEENEAVVHMILSNYKEMIIENIDLKWKYFKKWIKRFWKQIYRNDVEKSIRVLPSIETEWFFIVKFIKKIVD